MNAPNSCFNCANGTLSSQPVDFELTIPGKGSYSVPDVPAQVCSSCGDTTFGPEGSEKIEAWVKENLSIDLSKNNFIVNFVFIDTGEVSTEVHSSEKETPEEVLEELESCWYGLLSSSGGLRKITSVVKCV